MLLSNGSQKLTFEFDSNNSVAQGNVRVPFTPSGIGVNYRADADETDLVARAMRDAINSPQAFNVLGIFAAGRDSRDNGVMTGNRIDLFGDSIQVNPSSGRFLKVDLVAEETFYGRESARTLPEVDHDNQTVTEAIFYDTFAQATVTDYVNGTTDTLVAVGKIGDHVATEDANVLIPDSPNNDADIVKIYLNQGDTIDVDLDTNGWSLGTQFDDQLRVGFNVLGAALDGQSLTAKSTSGITTTLTLTLAPSTSPNEVQYFLSDSPLFLAFRLANAFDALDPSLNATFSSNDLLLPGAVDVTFDPGFRLVSTSLLEIYDEDIFRVADSSVDDGSADGESEVGSWINDFAAPTKRVLLRSRFHRSVQFVQRGRRIRRIPIDHPARIRRRP